MLNQQNFLRVIQVERTIDKYESDRSKAHIITEYFRPNLLLNVWNNQLNTNDCIRIIGILKPFKFMNRLIQIMDKEYPDKYLIEPHKEELEFMIISDEEGENQIEIAIKLYQSPDGYILGFNRNQGTDNNFLDIKNNVSNLVNNMLC